MLIPFAILWYRLYLRGMSLCAENHHCSHCETQFGREAIKLAEAQFADKLKHQYQYRLKNVVHLMTDCHAICPNCKVRHRYLGKEKLFIPISEFDDGRTYAKTGNGKP